MRKLNNKGISIIEIIISVALISVVMLFMYRMLSDITFEKESEFFASLNQEQRIEIIDTIQSKFLNQSISSYTLSRDGKTLTVNVGGTNNVIKIVDKATISLNSSDNHKWVIKNATFDNKITCVSASDAAVDNLIQCTIEVYTTNSSNKSGNNNTLDDIVFSFRK